MSTLTRAIEREDWDLAAWCLIWGFLSALSKVPPDAVIGLLDVVDGGEDWLGEL